MIPVMQTRGYDPAAPAGQQRGNCWSACIASLLELPIEQVPDFVQIEVDGGDSWWDQTVRFLNGHGHGMRLSDRGMTDDRVRTVAQRIVREWRAVGAEWDNDAGMIAAGAPWLTAGAVVGTVLLADVHPQNAACDPEVCQPWGEASYVEHGGVERVDIVHLVLERPLPVHPIPCRGKPGLWTVPDDIASRLGTA